MYFHSAHNQAAAAVDHLLLCLGVILLIAASSSPFVQATNFGEVAKEDASCTNGFQLYREDSVGIFGCYKHFSTALTWAKARDSCEVGQGGTLVAARTEGEQNFIKDLAGDLGGFWTSGYSSSASCASTSSCIWTWNGYQTSVNFSAPYMLKIESNDWTSRSQQALVDNYLTGVPWKYGDLSETYAYACRIQACSPGYSVSLETTLCQASSQSAQEDLSWIAGAVVGGLVFIVVVGLILLWKFQNDKYNKLMHWLKCHRPTTRLKMRIKELEDENERLRAQLRKTRGSSSTFDPVAGLGAGMQTVPPLPRLSMVTEDAASVASGNLPRIKPKKAESSPIPPSSVPLGSNRVAPMVSMEDTAA